jgi:carboxypeptidase C (cathepsin A)
MLRRCQSALLLLLLIALVAAAAAAVAASPTPAEYRVASLPGFDATMAELPELYSGYMPSPETRDAPAHYFFWHAPAHSDADAAGDAHSAAADDDADVPLVVWLQGGPGCTSQFGFFHENGPVRLSGDSTLTVNEHSWTRAPAHMLWFDQPVG